MMLGRTNLFRPATRKIEGVAGTGKIRRCLRQVGDDGIGNNLGFKSPVILSLSKDQTGRHGLIGGRGLERDSFTDCLSFKRMRQVFVEASLVLRQAQDDELLQLKENHPNGIRTRATSVKGR
jgi:hypothetical protein